MHRTFVTASLVLVAIFAVSAAHANGYEQLSFSWTAQEVCLGGHPGTFTPDGDMTDFFSQIPAFGSGVITFNPRSGTATDTGNWMFFLPQFFLPQPPGTPQNLFPARTSTGQCNWTYLPGVDLSWTLVTPAAGCGGPDTSGPNAGKGPFVFTNGSKIDGQFAADMQSFVAHRTELGIENGLDPYGNPFERICMRMIQGVRIPASRR